MASRTDILPPSPPPNLDVLDTRDERISTMADWFLENFDDPANSLPYDSREGGYQWLWGGPYEAVEELAHAFPIIEEDELAEAVDAVQDRNDVQEWTVASWRLPGAGVRSGQASHVLQRVPPAGDRRAHTIVETLLLPKLEWQWSVHATFVPGHTNQPLGSELPDEAASGGAAAGFEHQRFRSLRDLVLGLLDLQIERAGQGDPGDLEASRNWIAALDADSDLFVDDAIVVHASPAEWMPLAKLFGSSAMDAGSVTAIVVSADSPGKIAGYLLAYGGARIFVRLVHGLNFVQDAFFERIGHRIRHGDFDRGATARDAGTMDNRAD